MQYDVIIVGAGAAGLMCAYQAGQRGRRVLIIESSNKPGKKILMSGGGRCNFTNLHATPANYISHNPHFCKSALSRYTQHDFISFVKKHHIAYHEKKLGQLFCDDKAKDILNMLLSECEQAHVELKLNCQITEVENSSPNHYKLKTNQGTFICNALVIASGGLSIPSLGSSPFGYQIAEQFQIPVWPVRAGLVPLTLHEQDKEKYAPLSGISSDSLVQSKTQSFHEDLLFTHRGLSGPAILQISSYWEPGEALQINLLPKISLIDKLKEGQKEHPKQSLREFLAQFFARKLISAFLDETLEKKPLNGISHTEFARIGQRFQNWSIKPNGTEGYRTAEVTIGGVDCDAISSKTMECNKVPGLYFIGEVLDVTGWLGGYNFQWAWSSGWAAGQAL